MSSRLPAEELFQRLTIGTDLLNLLFVVDALEQGAEGLSTERRHALTLFLLGSQVYSKPQVAEAAYEELKQLKNNLSPEDPTEERPVLTSLKIEAPEADVMMRFLRAVMAQKEAGFGGDDSVLYQPSEVADPSVAARSLVEELLAQLTNVKA